MNFRALAIIITLSSLMGVGFAACSGRLCSGIPPTCNPPQKLQPADEPGCYRCCDPWKWEERLFPSLYDADESPVCIFYILLLWSPLNLFFLNGIILRKSTLESPKSHIQDHLPDRRLRFLRVKCVALRSPVSESQFLTRTLGVHLRLVRVLLSLNRSLCRSCPRISEQSRVRWPWIVALPSSQQYFPAVWESGTILPPCARGDSRWRLLDSVRLCYRQGGFENFQSILGWLRFLCWLWLKHAQLPLFRRHNAQRTSDSWLSTDREFKQSVCWIGGSSARSQHQPPWPWDPRQAFCAYRSDRQIERTMSYDMYAGEPR